MTWRHARAVTLQVMALRGLYTQCGTVKQHDSMARIFHLAS